MHDDTDAVHVGEGEVSVPIHLPPTEEASDQVFPLPKVLKTPAGLALLELQGTIHFPVALEQDASGAPLASTTIGRLEFPGYDAENEESKLWMKKVFLYVGQHQRMQGEVRKLSKPIAVVRRHSSSTTQEESLAEDLEIAEIIEYKIVFSHRPEPVGSETG